MPLALPFQTIYPRIIEIAVLVLGLVLAVYLSYSFHRLIYNASRNVFGVLNRHFTALFRASLVADIGQAFYFVVRIASVLTGNFMAYRLFFDLIAMAFLLVTLMLGLPLLKTLQTIPRVYKVQ